MDDSQDRGTTIARGLATLQWYESLFDKGGEDPETILSDLIADLHHLADYRGLGWFTILNRAQWHYDAEREEWVIGITPDEDEREVSEVGD